MRIYKFRAWDKTQRRLLTLETCTFTIKNTGFIVWDMDGNEILSHETGELMQFTGLLDKNGKEIYEGDVAKYFFKGNSRYYNLTVKDLLEVGMMIQDGFKYEESEVIGNIYENHELTSKQ